MLDAVGTTSSRGKDISLVLYKRTNRIEKKKASDNQSMVNLSQIVIQAFAATDFRIRDGGQHLPTDAVEQRPVSTSLFRETFQIIQADYTAQEATDNTHGPLRNAVLVSPATLPLGDQYTWR